MVAAEIEPPNDISLPAIVIPSFSSCEFPTPNALMVTLPLVTSKSADAKDAIPLLDVVASSPATVAVPDEYVTSIPSPAATITIPLFAAVESSALITPAPEISIPSPAEISASTPAEPEITSVPDKMVAAEIEPPNDISLPAIVIPSFSSCAFPTPKFLIDTLPVVTSKSPLSKDATPLLDVDASSPEITPAPEISIPSPAEISAKTPAEPEITSVPDKMVAAEIEPPNDISLPAIVIPSFSSCEFPTPNALIVTLPLVTAKSADAKDAIPLLVVDASSPEIVAVPSDVISIPSPAVNSASNCAEPDTIPAPTEATYPASLFNCDISEPDTTSFFHSAILVSSFKLYPSFGLCV